MFVMLSFHASSMICHSSVIIKQIGLTFLCCVSQIWQKAFTSTGKIFNRSSFTQGHEYSLSHKPGIENPAQGREKGCRLRLRMLSQSWVKKLLRQVLFVDNPAHHLALEQVDDSGQRFRMGIVYRPLSSTSENLNADFLMIFGCWMENPCLTHTGRDTILGARNGPVSMGQSQYTLCVT